MKVTLFFCLLMMCCVSHPPKRDVTVAIPESWPSETVSTDRVDDRWWESFNDPQLTGMISVILENNVNLVAMAARVRQAREAAVIAGAAQMPEVGLGLDGSRQKQNFIGLPIGVDGIPSATYQQHGLALNLSWEADLWGRLSAREKAAVARFQASEIAMEGLRLSLAGEAARTWFQVAAARQQLALSEAMIAHDEEEVAQIRERYDRGLRPAFDLRLALTALARNRATREQRLADYRQAIRRLHLLMGRYPDDRGFEAAEVRLPEGSVPAGLPADLISRRPDLAEAERILAAADATVVAARRDRYPRIRLTVSGGTASDDLGDLLDGDFSVWRLAAGLVQPIFQGGRLKAAVRHAEADVDHHLARYIDTVLRAYAEVETALANETHLAHQADFLQQAVTQAVAAESLADERYLAGLGDYLGVLEARRGSVQARSALIDAHAAMAINRVNLYLALGGGFTHQNPIGLMATAD